MSRNRWAVTARRTAVSLTVIALTLSVPAVAYAHGTAPAIEAAKTLPQVIAALRAWLMGILAAVATLYLVLAGVFWATAGGDPAQVDKARAV